MSQSVSSDQIDDAIADLLQLAIECTLQEKCTPVEAARVRLALAHPSPQVNEAMEESVALVLEAMEIGLPPLLNGILFPDDVP